MKLICGFDPQFYLAEYGDIAAAGVDPFTHFLTHGLKEARLPCSLVGGLRSMQKLLGFDAVHYQKSYPDVTTDPFEHYIAHGAREGRFPFSLSDNLEQEKVAFAELRRAGFSWADSLEKPVQADLDIEIADVRRLLAITQAQNLNPKPFRNNFWMVVGIEALARGWMGLAQVAYNFFFNHYLPMPLLGNGHEMQIIAARAKSVADYVASRELPHRRLPAAEMVDVPTPRFLNRVPDLAPDERHVLPQPLYAQLEDVEVLGECNLIRVGPHEILYDYLEPVSERQAELKAQFVMHHINGNCAIRLRANLGYVPEAFSLLHDHGHNYFHWLIEVLPRYLLARAEGLVDDSVPILVHNRIAAQKVAILKEAVGFAPTLIGLDPGQTLRVGRLHHVTDLSVNTVHTEHLPDRRDILISPTAVELLREIARPHMLTGVASFEKIIISRTNVDFRRLVNRANLETVLTAEGFVSFDPGSMDFRAQVRVFSNARFIVCEAGAALTNLIFCQPNATVVVLVNGCKYSNYFYLAEIAAIVGLNLVFFECLRLEGSHTLGVQDDMIVHVGSLRDELLKLMGRDPIAEVKSITTTPVHRDGAALVRQTNKEVESHAVYG